MLRQLRTKNSAIYKALLEFKKGLKAGKLMIPLQMPQLLFICGGNTATGPSFRRKNIIKFSERNITNSFPFLAETVFAALQEANRYQNLLQTEQTLFELADYIVIILESPSAFCELGAFSHYDKQRKKLIVINSEKFKDTKSFINLGPLQLIANENGDDSILWYLMDDDSSKDRIADIYQPFKKIIEKKHKKKRTSITELEFTLENKEDLLFLRDLIGVVGPVTEEELEVVLGILFSKNYKEIQATLLAVLLSLELIKFNSINMTYYSIDPKLFYEYDMARMRKIISPFKSYSIKSKRVSL